MCIYLYSAKIVIILITVILFSNNLHFFLKTHKRLQLLITDISLHVGKFGMPAGTCDVTFAFRNKLLALALRVPALRVIRLSTFKRRLVLLHFLIDDACSFAVTAKRMNRVAPCVNSDSDDFISVAYWTSNSNILLWMLVVVVFLRH